MATGLQSAHNNLNIEAIKNGLQSYVAQKYLLASNTTPLASGRFFSQIANRAPIVDLANDLRVNIGQYRIATHECFRIQNEAGPNNECVSAIPGDDYGMVRLAGDWGFENNVYGSHIIATVPGSFIEVTFYGTGLMLYGFCSNRTYVVNVDNGSDVTVSTGGSSAVENGRFYSPYTPIEAAKFLTQGIHTVKIRQTASGQNIAIQAIEVINSPSSTLSQALRANPGSAYIGGLKVAASAQAIQGPKTGFENISDASVGTRGGRAIVYLKASGSVAKAFTKVDATALYLNSADHSNEEVIRTYFPREFGTYRTDDFAGAWSSGATRLGVLDDGTTSLQGISSAVYSSQGPMQSGGSPEGAIALTGGSIYFTFVGTGLDLLINQSGGSADSYSVAVDGGAVGSLNTRADIVPHVQKVASGLPFGTHIVKLTRTTSTGAGTWISEFRVYCPKKPTLPEDALELADYNVVADYVANNTAGVETIAQGVVRKHIAWNGILLSEGTTGTTNWAYTPVSPTQFVGGIQVSSDRTNAAAYIWFYGTGMELRYHTSSNHSSDITVAVNGVQMSAGQPFSGATYGGGTFNGSFGKLSQQNASSTFGCGFRALYGFLGWNRFSFHNNNSNQHLVIQSADLITPIHSYDGQVLSVNAQNTFSAGAGVLDNRKTSPFPLKEGRLKARAKGRQNSVTSFLSGGSSPHPLISVPIRTYGGKLSIDMTTYWENQSSGNPYLSFYILVDGKLAGLPWTHQINANVGGIGNPFHFHKEFQVPAGYHIVTAGFLATSVCRVDETELWVREE
jgi:hypothetical protein